GSGQVELSMSANTGPARSGTVAIAGRSVPVAQESGCTYALSSTGTTIPSTGGSGTVNVTAGAGCPWTAVSNAAWITVTAGASGSGDGAVQFAVQANMSGAGRSGAIAIAGHTFTVTQQ
ncbi:MAG: BACON domain-containing protein, partial [Burkholderiales bacterium]